MKLPKRTHTRTPKCRNPPWAQHITQIYICLMLRSLYIRRDIHQHHDSTVVGIWPFITKTNDIQDRSASYLYDPKTSGQMTCLILHKLKRSCFFPSLRNILERLFQSFWKSVRPERSMVEMVEGLVLFFIMNIQIFFFEKQPCIKY